MVQVGDQLFPPGLLDSNGKPLPKQVLCGVVLWCAGGKAWTYGGCPYPLVGSLHTHHNHVQHMPQRLDGNELGQLSAQVSVQTSYLTSPLL